MISHTTALVSRACLTLIWSNHQLGLGSFPSHLRGCYLYYYHMTGGIPSSKLTVRPWQSSGLEEKCFHYKLVIFRVYVNLPEGNHLFTSYFRIPFGYQAFWPITISVQGQKIADPQTQTGSEDASRRVFTERFVDFPHFFWAKVPGLVNVYVTLERFPMFDG